jgi:formylglycine-generating enzyme required for sulfatase activity
MSKWSRTGLCLAAFLVCACAAWAGDIPAEKTYVNSLGMRLVRIEPGSFMMGSLDGDFDERPVHRVTISQPFWMSATEVTNAQYEAFDPSHRKLRGKLGWSKEDDEAVVFVTWHDAVRFCEWLSKKWGRPCRLPTEAEWEYACRAGTTMAYHTGDALKDPSFHKNVGESWFPDPARRGKDGPVPLHVGRTPPNPWGLYDVHGNVEEWCLDWYGPYEPQDQTDPVGRAHGDFRVTRGGSHSTELKYLRSANRLGTLPEDSSWLIGFRVVLGKKGTGPICRDGPEGASHKLDLSPFSPPLPVPSPPLHQRDVRQEPSPQPSPEGVGSEQPSPRPSPKGRGGERPYFRGPRQYVKVPPGSLGPLFSQHNHDPAIVDCPNGDLLAIWYTCLRESGRELAVAASRLRYGADEWEPAAPFWDAPDRNDHAPALWTDGKTLYHFNGLSAAATWGNPAVIMRTSTDSGATWSKARLIAPEHGLRHQPVESVIRTRDGAIVLPCDAVTGGSGGTALLISRDGGRSWRDPGEGKPKPQFRAGARGAWIAGIHAAVVELKDSRLMAFGRGDPIDGHMPKSVSSDGGATWEYSASPFPPIGGGQRLVLLRLAEGPIFFASFAQRTPIKDASGNERTVSGLFGALSFDEGQTWPARRLVTDDGPPRQLDGGGNTGRFTLGPDSAEPRGYMAVCQAGDGVIHLISSKQHYAFNLAWLKTPMPAKTGTKR